MEFIHDPIMRLEHRSKAEDFARKLKRKDKGCTVIFNIEEEPITINDSDGENTSDDITENGTAHAYTEAGSIGGKQDRSIDLHVSTLLLRRPNLSMRFRSITWYRCTIFAKSE